MIHNRQDAASTAAEIAKSAPPVGVGGLTLWGQPLDTWVLILTAIWTVFLIIDKFPVVVTRLLGFARWIKGLFNGRK